MDDSHYQVFAAQDDDSIQGRIDYPTMKEQDFPNPEEFSFYKQMETELLVSLGYSRKLLFYEHCVKVATESLNTISNYENPVHKYSSELRPLFRSHTPPLKAINNLAKKILTKDNIPPTMKELTMKAQEWLRTMEVINKEELTYAAEVSAHQHALAITHAKKLAEFKTENKKNAPQKKSKPSSTKLRRAAIDILHISIDDEIKFKLNESSILSPKNGIDTNGLNRDDSNDDSFSDFECEEDPDVRRKKRQFAAMQFEEQFRAKEAKERATKEAKEAKEAKRRAAEAEMENEKEEDGLPDLSLQRGNSTSNGNNKRQRKKRVSLNQNIDLSGVDDQLEDISSDESEISKYSRKSGSKFSSESSEDEDEDEDEMDADELKLLAGDKVKESGIVKTVYSREKRHKDKGKKSRVQNRDGQPVNMDGCKPVDIAADDDAETEMDNLEKVEQANRKYNEEHAEEEEEEEDDPQEIVPPDADIVPTKEGVPPPNNRKQAESDAIMKDAIEKIMAETSTEKKLMELMGLRVRKKLSLKILNDEKRLCFPSTTF